MAHLVASRPPNEQAAADADEEFYRTHGRELVKNGVRQPLDYCDPKHKKLREKWLLLYQKFGGKVEKAPPPKKCGDANQCCPKERGAIAVRVVDAITKRILVDADVDLNGPLRASAKTGIDGVARFSDLPPGAYTLEGSKERYSSETEQTEVEAGQTTVVVLELAPQGIRGYVWNAVTGTPIERAKVTLSFGGKGVRTDDTDRNGMYVFTDLEAGSYDLEASKKNFTYEGGVDIAGVVEAGQMTRVDIHLQPIATFSVRIRLSESEKLRVLLPLEDLRPSSSTDGKIPSSPWRFSKVGFRVEIESDDAAFRADRTEFRVADAAGVLFVEIQSSDFVTVGKHLWLWDGFDSSSTLDTRRLLNKDLNVTVDVTKGNITQSGRVDLANIPFSVDWVSLQADLPAKTVEIQVELDLEPKKEVTAVSSVNGMPVVQTSDLSTSDSRFLKQLALSGIGRYWSRKITVSGDDYQVDVRAVENGGSSVDLEIYKVTANEEFRSHNSGIIDGELFYLLGWYSARGKTAKADDRFRETAAHEWGHSVLSAFGFFSSGDGTDLSWRHKGSSSMLQEANGAFPKYPLAPQEIDLMIYYEEKFEPTDYFQRVVAAEEDVKRLIWLAGIRFQED